MARSPHRKLTVSRRRFLQTFQCSPVLFLPAPLRAWPFAPFRIETAGAGFPLAEHRLTPHYPAKSPLDDLLLQAVPGMDEYVTEKYAFEVSEVLAEWSSGLRETPPNLSVISRSLDASIEANSLAPSQEDPIRTGGGIDVLRKQFASEVVVGREKVLKGIATYLVPMSRIETVTFDVVGVKRMDD